MLFIIRNTKSEASNSFSRKRVWHYYMAIKRTQILYHYFTIHYTDMSKPKKYDTFTSTVDIIHPRYDDFYVICRRHAIQGITLIYGAIPFERFRISEYTFPISPEVTLGKMALSTRLRVDRI